MMGGSKLAATLVLLLLGGVAAAKKEGGRRTYDKGDLGDVPGPRDTDSECGEWRIGTATGYATDGTDEGDLPMHPNDLGEYVVPKAFLQERNVVAVDWADWGESGYRSMEVSLDGEVGTLEVWDFCNDKDCSADNANCCSQNKAKWTHDESDPGFLVDIHTTAAKKIWNLQGSQNWLMAPVWYRICGEVDQNATIAEFNLECWGVAGDGNCTMPAAPVGTGFTLEYNPDEEQKQF